MLRANEVVSSDTLVEELWGADRPEDTATALQAHVSRLRKALPGGAELVKTVTPGYVLRVSPEQVDLERFERAVADGREALEEGQPERAATLLRDALAMWRGRPLADLENEPFVRGEILRLDESWLAAVEARIEADLALGRHDELVPELQALVRAHPLRERLRAQLMLALYRSGRQADALEVYGEGRRMLVDELGLEPDPALQRLQQAILVQAPELAAHARPRPAARAGRVPVVAVIGVAAAVVAVGALAVERWRGSDAGVPGGAGQVVGIDVSDGKLEHRVAAGRTPSAIAAHDGVAWLVDADARTVVRVDTGAGSVETLATGSTPTDVAADDTSVWVATGRRLASSQFVGPVGTGVVRLDAATRTERTQTDLPAPEGAVSNLVDDHLATSDGAAWMVTPDFAVARIDRGTGAITATSRDLPAMAVASGGAGVWSLGVDGQLARLDERTARTVRRTRVPAPSVGSIAVGDRAVWITSPTDGGLWKVDVDGDPGGLGRIELEPGITDVAVAAGVVVVVNPSRATVTLVDPERPTEHRSIALDGVPRAVAVDGGTAWVAVAPGPSTGVAGAVDGVRTFGGDVCEAPLAGPDGKADVLITSDLPLQGGVRVTTTQMAQAIAFVLRERGFKAGAYRVAYQSCDDSIASTGLFDEAKCEANARAYARNPDVVGVVGTFNSPCALAALPTLNSAPDGPLAMISPLNSFVGLTRTGVGVDPSLPAALYPTGTRSYARVYPADDLQGAALALFARDRGVRRVFVLDDGEPGYGVLMAAGFQTAARRLGLRVAGRASWDPRARGYEALAERVARSGARAVFVGGLLDSGAARVVKALRARLGPDVALLGPDGLTPLPVLTDEGGKEAIGVYVSLGGLVTQGLPPAGVRFVQRFGRTQPGASVEPSAVYAAQSAEVLLDAIARSDGTRASVAEQLLATRVRGGLLGAFRFDANGDISESPVTILRVVGQGSSNTVASIEGGEVVRVVRPSPTLVSRPG